MVATTDAQQRAMMYLKTLELMLADLPHVAADWESIDADERMSWSLDWSTEVAEFNDLARLASQGRLIPEQQARYAHVLEELKAAMPTIARLGLRRPPLLATRPTTR